MSFTVIHYRCQCRTWSVPEFDQLGEYAGGCVPGTAAGTPGTWRSDSTYKRVVGSTCRASPDDDACLRGRDSWGGLAFTCASAKDHPERGCDGSHAVWSQDMRECCPQSCRPPILTRVAANGAARAETFAALEMECKEACSADASCSGFQVHQNDCAALPPTNACSSLLGVYGAPQNPSASAALSACGAGNSPGESISSAAACQAAWESIGVAVTEVVDGSFSGRTPENGHPNFWVPAGCSMQKSGGTYNGRLHWNTADDGLGGGGYDLLCTGVTSCTGTSGISCLCAACAAQGSHQTIHIR